MKITKLKSKNQKLRFVIDKSTFGFANALRRVIMFEVPTLAIEDIFFVENSSALYDEIIAHRLGLIPLKTDLKTYNLPDKCVCKGKGCARCQVKFTLKEKGPKTVYAEELKTTDANIKPVYPDTPVVELLENQAIELEAVAKLGIGLTHMKWSPALAYYCKQPKKKVDLNKLENYDLWRAGNKDSGEDDTFIFILESWGQLSNKEILKQATKIMQDKLKEIKIK